MLSFRTLRSPFVLLSFGLALACDEGGTDPSGTADTESVDDGGSDGGGSEGGDGDQFFEDAELNTILTWLGPLPPEPAPDPSNAWADDPAAAAFGQKLFFEPGYSENGEVSCATCHDPKAAFDDDRANTSEGITFTERSSMSVLNGAYAEAAEDSAPWQFWDGRSDSQWSQALGPPENPVEMGSARTTVALLINDTYAADYEAVFGPLPTLHDADGVPLAPPGSKPGDPEWDELPDATKQAYNQVYVNFGKAIAAYERLLVSRNSRFDQFWEEIAQGAKDSTAMSDIEKQGLRVFFSQGRCLGCHGGRNFTDGQFHNDAVAQVGDNVAGTDEGRAAAISKVQADPFNCVGEWSDHPDKSSCAVSALDGAVGEMGAFKTPSLRDVANRAPFMHTGNFATLDQVILHYDNGGAAPSTFVGTRDELMRPLMLSAPDRQALVAFLFALSGEPLPTELVTDPR